MNDSFEQALARRGKSAVKLGAWVIVVATTAYYLAGCVCGMNAGFGKRFWSISDDHWELSECFYASVVTLTTVGYTDLLGTELCKVECDDGGRYRWISNTDGHQHPDFDESTAQTYFDFSALTRVLTAVQVIVGFSFFLYVVAQLTSFFVEGEYGGLKRALQVRRQIKRLRGHIIVAGAGETSHGVVRQLQEANVPCVVTELSQERADQLRAAFPRIPCLHGDATEEDTLKAAGVERALGMVTALDDDRLNLVAVVTSRQLNSDVRIVSQGIEASSPSRLRHAGANSVVLTSALVGLRTASELVRPAAVAFMDVLLYQRDRNGFHADGVNVGPQPAVACIADLLKQDAPRLAYLSVIRARDGMIQYNPEPDAPLEAGNHLSVIGTREEIDRLRQVLDESDRTPPDRSIQDLKPTNYSSPIPPVAGSAEHYIVCGIGEKGVHVLRELAATGRSFVAIDSSLERVQQLSNEWPGARIIHGDAQDPRVLREAGVENTSGLATTLLMDRDNLVVAVTAKQMRESLRVVSLVGDERHAKRLSQAGVIVVKRGRIGGRRMAAELLQSRVTWYIDRMLDSSGATRFEAVVCSDDAPLAGTNVDQAQIHQQTGMRIIALRRPNESVFVPHPDGLERWLPGTVAIVIGTPEQVNKLAGLVGHWE